MGAMSLDLRGRLSRPNTALIAAAFALSLALPACSGESTGSTSGSTSAGGSSTSSGGTSNENAPVYALVSYVIGPEGTNTYVNLLTSLDVSDVDVLKGREFPGSAGAGVSSGKLFVSSGDAPTITRFDVKKGAADWTEEATISFGKYGSSAPLFTNGFVSPTKAYMAFDVTQRAVWDPQAMTITGSKAAPTALPLAREGLKIGPGYDRSIASRGDRMFWPFYWHDDNYQAFSPLSQIAIYDTKTDENVGLLDVPCPDIDYASKAEDGTVYFSSWGFGVTGPAFDEKAGKTCIARIKAGEETLDASFTASVASLTEGREGMGFHYLKDDKGFLSVFHKERLAAGQDPKSAIFTANWRIWLVDLNARSAKPVESIPYFAGGGSNIFTIDDRVFILFPTAADYSASAAYEILPDGTAVKRFTSKGWAAQLLRVR